MLDVHIQQHFIDSADLKYQLAEPLAKPIAAAVQTLVASLTSGGKVLAGGLNAAAPLAQMLTQTLVGRFERERPGLAALALGRADAQGAGWARQIEALGQAGDVLVLLVPDAAVAAASAAVAAAHGREMTVLALTARDSGELATLLHETDVQVRVPHERVARVLEVQHLVLNALCDGIDFQLLGEQEIAG